MDGRSGGILLSVALAFSMTDGSSAQDEGRRKPPRQVGPDVIELDHSDISLPLRDIAPIPPRFQDNEEHPVKKLPHRHPFRPLGSRPDPVIQTLAPGSLVSTTPGLSFDGVGVPNYGDAPNVVVWPDAYYGTATMYNAAGTAFLGSKLCAYDRNQMITATGTPGGQQCFQLSSTSGGVLPSDWDGATPPPAGAPNYMIAFDDAGLNGLNLWKFHVDWASPGSSSLTGPTKISGAAF